MKRVRVIIASDGAAQEKICFTLDFKAPISDFIFFDDDSWKVETDEIISMDLPSYFPLDYEFSRH